MVDCGIPFKSITSVAADLALVLLTHEHGDHLNTTTLRKLAHERPMLRFGVPPYLVERVVSCGVPVVNVDIIETDQRVYDYGPFKVQAFPLLHNVPNCGYKLEIDGKRVLYATDTNSIKHIEAKHYDLYLLEANYTESEIVQRIRDKQESGAFCHEWRVLENHLSAEKASDWLYSQMGPRSEYMFLHQHQEKAG